jgi:hypothetical protein
MIPLFLKLYGLPVLGSNFLPYCVIVTLVGCFYGFIILGVGREVYLISIGNI